MRAAKVPCESQREQHRRIPADVRDPRILERQFLRRFEDDDLPAEASRVVTVRVDLQFHPAALVWLVGHQTVARPEPRLHPLERLKLPPNLLRAGVDPDAPPNCQRSDLRAHAY